MDIEILSGKASINGELDRVDIKFHEGPLHNQKFLNIKPLAILHLIWNKKIKVKKKDIDETCDYLLKQSINKDRNTSKFLLELNKLK